MDIIVIVIKGTKTINQDITVNPLLHNKFNKNEYPIIIINHIKSKLYKPLNISIIICVKENTIFKMVGKQNN